MEVRHNRVVTAFLQYVPQLTGCPALATTDVPTTFALAPIGVALPPISVPMERAHVIVLRSTPVEPLNVWITGIMVAANGMLSTKADAIALTQMMIAIMMYGFPPEMLLMNPAMSLRISVCSSPPTTTKSPRKKRTVL